MGTEHEKFGFCLDTLKPLPYDGERSIRAILEGLARQYGWRRVQEEGPTPGREKDDCSVSLEPGGQLELSGALLDNVHQTGREANAHLAEVRCVAEPPGRGIPGGGLPP